MHGYSSTLQSRVYLVSWYWGLHSFHSRKLPHVYYHITGNVSMVLEMATNGPRKILANFLFADSVSRLIVHAHMTE